MTDLTNPSYYINRELSTIEFNRRVLLESLREEHPLLERVKFCAIYNNNMDEFFMVRVASIKQQVLMGVTDSGPDGLTPREQLLAIHRTITALLEQQMSHWRQTLRPRLAQTGVHILDYTDLKKRQIKRLSDYFEREIFPVLTPLAFDPGHPFPHISNLSMNLAVVIRDPDEGRTHFARVKVPSILPRLVPLNPLDPDDLLPPAVQKFVWVEQVIVDNLGRLFPGMEIVASHPFRVTRNTDMEIQEDEADDLLITLEENLRQRHFGFVVRLEVDETLPDWIREMLMDNLEVTPHDVYTVNGPLDLHNLMDLMKLDRPDLKDPPLYPTNPPPLAGGESVINVLRRQDLLLHHPYDSFNHVVDFVNTAATDPNVLAIKQTLYRVGPNSPIVHALMRARENGKQVTVLVELKARFDEESNIEWARALENTGVHVVYGLIGLKTHGKACLVVRREKEGIRRYVHMGTGNYNSFTARIYTDLGFLTSNEEIGADISELFNYLTGYSKQKEFRKCWVAPINLREKMTAQIEKETERGADGRLIFKFNHLVDPRLIQALYRASQAGVQIDLMIRGICCLRPGIPGVSDNIRVISHIGRFLEHTRIYYFHNGGQPLLYVGSADMMQRNLDRRVEILFPIEDETLRQEVIQNLLHIYWQDTQKAYKLGADGRYTPLATLQEEGAPLFHSQEWYLTQRTTLLQTVGLGEK
jgi:polyphosphate kinase